MTPSLAFSATVSTAALVTPSAVRFCVSRPTMRATALRAAGRSPFLPVPCTRCGSPARPLAASAWPHQSICSASPSAGWSLCCAPAGKPGNGQRAQRQHRGHRGPAGQLAPAAFWQCGAQVLFQRRDAPAHEHHRMRQPRRVAKQSVQQKPPSTAQKSACALLRVLHGLDQTQLMPRRPVAGVQHIAARVGAAPTGNSCGAARRSAPTRPSGRRRGPGSPAFPRRRPVPCPPAPQTCSIRGH